MAAKKEKQAKGKAISFKDIDTVELLKTENDLRKELLELRFKLKVASLPNVKKIQENKRNIARILTEIKSRALAESKK